MAEEGGGDRSGGLPRVGDLGAGKAGCRRRPLDDRRGRAGGRGGGQEIVPVVGGLIALLAFIWQIVAMVIAVRQCLDYTSTWRAFFVVLISLVPWVVLMIIALVITGIGASVF